MNTQDNWQTTATIHDEHRAAVWGAIFPGARVPIRSIIPARADLPGHPSAGVYFLDLQAITEVQLEQLIEQLSSLFLLSPEAVRADIAERGVPILAEDVSIESTDQSQVLVLLDDWPADSPGLYSDDPDDPAGLNDFPAWEDHWPDEDDARQGVEEWDPDCTCDLCLASREDDDDE